jgi:hypothetical protein
MAALINITKAEKREPESPRRPLGQLARLGLHVP